MSDAAAFREWFGGRYPGREPELDRLLLYAAAVLRHRGRGGLISRHDADAILMRHVAESIAVPVLAAIPEDARVLDVGSGAGLPGIPIAILRPDVRMVLVEPRSKKATFLERETLVLGLRGARVERVSLEELALRETRVPAAVAISRGVRWLPGMVRALGACLALEGDLLRFGDLNPGVPGVEAHHLGTGAERGIQRWPRRTWDALPGAR